MARGALFHSGNSMSASTSTIPLQHARIRNMNDRSPNSWTIFGNIYSDFYAYGIRSFLIGYQKFSDYIRNFLMNQKLSDSVFYRYLRVKKESMRMSMRESENFWCNQRISDCNGFSDSVSDYYFTLNTYTILRQVIILYIYWNSRILLEMLSTIILTKNVWYAFRLFRPEDLILLLSKNRQ